MKDFSIVAEINVGVEVPLREYERLLGEGQANNNKYDVDRMLDFVNSMASNFSKTAKEIRQVSESIQDSKLQERVLIATNGVERNIGRLAYALNNKNIKQYANEARHVEEATDQLKSLFSIKK